MRPSADRVAIVALVLVAAAYTVGVTWWNATLNQLRVSYDIYAAHYPNAVYALRSLRLGYGLLWNPYQNCGQPFLPSTLVGLLYPLQVLFLVFDLDTAYYVLAGLHLAIAGVFAFLLCREYGLGTTGAVSGALAFMLGGSALALTAWLPTTILGPYVWIPASLWMTERILKRPSLARALGLGVFLTLGLLPGYPQISLFTYQLIALRVLWELATNRAVRRVAVLGALALGLVLPVFLGAAYLLPSIEFARQSVRGRALSMKEMHPLDTVDLWRQFRNGAGMMTNSFVPILALVPTTVAALALLERRTWRLTAFYALCTALFMLLAFDQAFFDWYRSLPLGSTFREPMRFIWVVSFTASVLVGIGADRVSRASPPSPVRALLLGATVLLGAYLFSLVCARPFAAGEWALFALALAAVVGTAVLRHGVAIAAVAVPAILAANLYTQGSHPFMQRLANAPETFHRHDDAFAFLRERMSPLDRMYHFGEHQDYSLTPKVASVFGIPTIDDYEPQTSQRFAELTVQLFNKVPMTSINLFNFRLNVVPLRWPLFDLLAARYVVMDPAGNRYNFPLKPSLQPVWTDGNVRILENPGALPRAFFVPALAVVPDPARLLEQLASGQWDSRRVALVEAPPADGFLGRDGAGAGEVTSFTDHAEVVTVDMRAPNEGFLVLTDQYYPGWEATVNGIGAPILRANYVFRAVRVPAGESRVVFRYRPRTVRWGVILSLVSAGAVAACLGGELVRRRGPRPAG